MRALVLLVLSALLAGCTTSNQESTKTVEPEPGDKAILLADLSASQCEYNDFIFLVPTADAQALLPAGFHAREFTDGVGALVLNAFDCHEGFAWNGMDLFVFALPPMMPEIVETYDVENRTARGSGDMYDLDLYSLAAHTDNETLRRVFEMVVPVGDGSVNRNSVQASGLATATVTLDAPGTTLVTATQTTARVDGLLGGQLVAHHRQWHVAENGTWLLERVMTREGAGVDVTQGAAVCIVDATTTFAPFVASRPCAIGQDALGGMEWTGRAYFFHGVAPA